MIKYVSTLLVSAVLISCGGSDNSSKPKEKDLFSVWTRDSDQSTFDLSSGEFRKAVPFTVFRSGGEECLCDMTFIGTQDSGTVITNSCIYQEGTGAGDPSCDIHNITSTYQKGFDTLAITNTNGVATFH